MEGLLRQALAPPAPSPAAALQRPAGLGDVSVASLTIPLPDLRQFDRLLAPEEVAR